MTRRRARDERGSAVLEFALVFPLVVLSVLGVVQYGYHFWALETGAATAREAARRLVVGTDPVCTVAEAVERLDVPHVLAADPTVVVEYGDPPSASTPPARGLLVTVTVTLRSLDMGLFPVPGDGLVVERAQNRVENVPIDPLACENP